MKKLMLSLCAVMCFSAIASSQQDSTNRTKTQQEQRKKDSGTNEQKGNNSKSSKRKMNKQKADSVNSNMDTTTRMETR
jgi:hypothetical protein